MPEITLHLTEVKKVIVEPVVEELDCTHHVIRVFRENGEEVIITMDGKVINLEVE